MNLKRIFQGMAALALLLIASVPAVDAAANSNIARVSGSGRAMITHDACEMTAWASGGTARPECLTEVETPIQWRLRATIDEDGTADGTIHFTIGNPLDVDSWYGTEYYDRGLRFALDGEVTSGYVRSDGAVVIEGLTDVTDYLHSPRETFYTACDRPDCFEPRVPFEVVMGGDLGDEGMTLKWCEVPGPLAIEITRGKIVTKVFGREHDKLSAAETLAESASAGCRSSR